MGPSPPGPPPATPWAKPHPTLLNIIGILSPKMRSWVPLPSQEQGGARGARTAASLTLVLLSPAWCLRNEGVSSVLLGASNAEQLMENIGAIQVSTGLPAELHPTSPHSTGLPSTLPDMRESAELAKALLRSCFLAEENGQQR